MDRVVAVSISVVLIGMLIVGTCTGVGIFRTRRKVRGSDDDAQHFLYHALHEFDQITRSQITSTRIAENIALLDEMAHPPHIILNAIAVASFTPERAALLEKYQIRLEETIQYCERELDRLVYADSFERESDRDDITKMRETLARIKMRLIWDIPTPETLDPIANAAALREAFRENQ